MTGLVILPGSSAIAPRRLEFTILYPLLSNPSDSERFMWRRGGERLGPGVRFEKDAPVNHFSDWLLLTLGARDFSSAVSGFCQAYGRRCVGLRLTTKIPTAREKNLWYPGYLLLHSTAEFFRAVSQTPMRSVPLDLPRWLLLRIKKI